MRPRIASLLAVFVLVCTACGARLNDEQYRAAVQAASGSGTSTTTTTTGGTTTGGTTATGGLGGGGGTTQAGGPTAGTSSTGTGGGGGSGPSGGGGGGGGGTSNGGSNAGQSGACQGQGGSTDTGVTSSTVRLATIYNGTGPQPGIFNSAYQATQAAAAYFNSQGGICGRDVKIDAIDDHTNTSDNRAATQQACSQDFAIVGSMSAFDDGGPSVAEKCGIPDLPAIPVTPPHQLEKGGILHASYPNRPDYFIEAYPRYIKAHYPDVIKHAGILWLNASATRSNAQARVKAYEHIGFDFVVQREVQITEPDYTPYVAELRERGVKYVTMVADYQSISRFNKAMQQQNWFPEVRDWDSVVYDPRFIQQTGPAADGSLFYLDTAMFEEASSNPEMKLYEYWLNKISPGAQPTYFGMYSWSAARLFQKAALAVGSNLTREALLKELESIHSWDDYGMHAAHDPGRELPSPCIMYGKISGGKFVRVYPSKGFSCSLGGLLHQSAG